ncbi:MAG: hypothetical protein KDI25_05435 [Pseudomonadales bacterium]|nr:hypothetical protein [Pseudomonadales bacterium]
MQRDFNNINIRTWAVLISLLLSVWHALINPIPNADAFEYVRIAHVSIDEGIAAAFALYPSATYPVLMGIVHRLTGFDLFTAGHVVNALCFALLVFSFITLVQQFRSGPRVTLLAALVILAFPSLNEVRYFLIRDIGFLALMFSAAVQLVCFGRTRWPRHGIAFVLLSLGAALFRAEALVYLPLVPLVLLFAGREEWGRNVRAVLALEAALLTGGILALLAGAMSGFDIPGTLQRMLQVYWPFLRDALQSISAENSPLNEAIFGEYAANFSDDYLWAFMLAGLTAVLLLSLLEAFGLPALLLFAWGGRRGMPRGDTLTTRVVLAYALVGFLILLGFLVLTRFLTTRYTLLFCLMMLAFLPLVLDRAWAAATGSQRPRLWRGLLIFLLLFSAVDSHISFGKSKESLQQACDWLQQNTQEGTTVLTNSSYVAYFSGRVADYDKVVRYLADDAIENASFGTIIALAPARGIDEQIQHNLEFRRIEPLAQFPADGEAELLVFRRLGN